MLRQSNALKKEMIAITPSTLRFSVVGVAVQHIGTPFFMMDRANICYLGHDVNA